MELEQTDELAAWIPPTALHRPASSIEALQFMVRAEFPVQSFVCVPQGSPESFLPMIQRASIILFPLVTRMEDQLVACSHQELYRPAGFIETTRFLHVECDQFVFLFHFQKAVLTEGFLPSFDPVFSSDKGSDNDHRVCLGGSDPCIVSPR